VNYSINHKETEIFFTVELRNRRSTSIQVNRDRSVRVLAPKLSTKRAILQVVSEKADWILKKQGEFSQQPPAQAERRYLSGEKFGYLGRELELKLITGSAGVEIEGEKIVMTAPEYFSTEQRKKLFQNWYRKQSEEIFAERLDDCMKFVKTAGIRKKPEFSSRIMRRSWGSCTAKRQIHLNIELISAAVQCIDFVILHELCHLKEPNHSPRFYNLLEKVCPGWKTAKNELKKTGSMGIY